MTDLKYTFLPFLRQGLGGLIADVDNLAGATGAINQKRAKVKIKLTAKGTKVADNQEELLNFNYGGVGGAQTTLEKEAEIYGPGDIVGINKDSVVRTDPSDWITNFEPNYLPYIEFWDEDFPWRYTPLAPSGDAPLPDGTAANQKLRPWISLVVMKEDEFIKNPVFNGILPSFKVNNKPFQNIFPDEKTMWAWANVHINEELPANISLNTALGNLNTKLKDNPALAVSRIICPRRLEPNTGYSCFLIPTFEMGRCAGLGIASTTTDMQKPSWKWDGTNASNVEFPYYYEWFFKTGTSGDFEALAGLLFPVKLDPELMGKRWLDIQDPGDSTFYNLTPDPPDMESLQGALRPEMTSPPNDDWWSPPPGTNPSAYKTKLKELMNTSSEYLLNGSTGDPVITPPIYGRWHAKVDKLDTGKSDWINKINLDPKFRVMASAGAEVVRKNQELFMQIAWEQVKDVEEANRLINQLYLGLESAQSTYDKSYATITDENKLLFSSGVHARIIGSGSVTIFQNTKDSRIPDACFTGSFIKASRNNAFLAKNFSATSALNTNTLISNLNSGSIVVANSYTKPTGQNSYTIQPASNLTAMYSLSVPNRPTFSITVPSNNYYSPGNGITNSPMSTAFRTAVANVHAVIGTIKAQVAVKPSLTLSTAATTVSNTIKPTNSILSAANKLLNVASVSGQAVTLTAVTPIMACPKIETPVFDYLYDLSPDMVVPNLNALPQNSVSLMEMNKEVIESFMVGMNHEMASELLWREYPTDQRGTVFSRFFGSYTAGGTTGTPYEKTRFIKPIHLWKSGNNLTNLGTNKPDAFAPTNILIVAVRGELLKKYPNTIIYAQKAKWQLNANQTANDTTKPRVPTNLDQDTIMPLFFSKAADISFFGFDLDKVTAKGSSFTGNVADDPSKPGWFFLFKEMIGEVHYGLDEYIGNPTLIASNMPEWDSLSWGYMPATGTSQYVSVSINFPLASTNVSLTKNAADVSHILLRKPAFVCIHAKELLS